MIVSDADHATTYTFTLEVEDMPEDEPPLSIMGEEDNCLEYEELEEDNPNEPECLWPGISLCEGITSFEELGDNFFINAAPCLLFPPAEETELDFSSNISVTFLLDSYDFDDDVDDLEIEVIIDEEILELCEDCFSITDEEFTITTAPEIAESEFTCQIKVSDESHSVIYEFTIIVGEDTGPAQV